MSIHESSGTIKGNRQVGFTTTQCLHEDKLTLRLWYKVEFSFLWFKIGREINIYKCNTCYEVFVEENNG